MSIHSKRERAQEKRALKEEASKRATTPQKRRRPAPQQRSAAPASARHHEAGHAIAAHAAGGRVVSVVCRRDEQHVNARGLFGHLAIAFSLAGPLAEERYAANSGRGLKDLSLAEQIEDIAELGPPEWGDVADAWAEATKLGGDASELARVAERVTAWLCEPTVWAAVAQVADLLKAGRLEGDRVHATAHACGVVMGDARLLPQAKE
jgi:hypothetical protein